MLSSLQNGTSLLQAVTGGNSTAGSFVNMDNPYGELLHRDRCQAICTPACNSNCKRILDTENRVPCTVLL